MADTGSLEPEETRTMPMDYDRFFTGYLDAFNQALDGNLDVGLIRDFYTDKFLAAGPGGVNTGRNSFLFGLMLRRSYTFYRKIGTRRLRLIDTEVTPIDERHDMVKVSYRADYVRPVNQQPLSLDFSVVYMIQKSPLYPKIFAFVAGDEMQAYRDAGLI